MKYTIKKPSSCTRKEINGIYTLLLPLTHIPSYRVYKKIKASCLIWFCLHNNNIIAISAIKQPTKKRIQTITKESGFIFPKDILEYWNIYVLPRYRWLWITKKLKQHILARVTNPLFSTTKKDNTAMNKLLQQFQFTQRWCFTNPVTGNHIILYTK